MMKLLSNISQTLRGYGSRHTHREVSRQAARRGENRNQSRLSPVIRSFKLELYTASNGTVIIVGLQLHSSNVSRIKTIYLCALIRQSTHLCDVYKSEEIIKMPMSNVPIFSYAVSIGGSCISFPVFCIYIGSVSCSGDS